MVDSLLKIGKLAKLAGVLPSTIHFYTQMGLLAPSDRSRGGYRLYDPALVERVKTIQELQQVRRLTIAEIRQQIRQG